ncbi:hypothetical protein PPL_00507 [Heterostelium album PN500]|uniref:Saposin B-type domain-containing protein n=1 Tax=Heterostelium pallidum (strain ATCC 26659 / Pp 5 / PN500) TaxID=670386 RepID=D3AWN1_HETP5|nr:hypothetical protein PPL_00507 [Heterostelium album PN500]EFA86704.1 hypothetical protein PPL_00507 [Heterostelium album PN500]|eukprot:XP_020438808.1 hypothetical protein PPL_00507 [Heterostelium album PN500]
MTKITILPITVFLLLVLTLFVAKSTNASAVDCDLCQLSIDELSEMAQTDNLTYSDIYNAIDRICRSIPSYSYECSAILNSSGDSVIHQILNGTSSNVICRELMCYKQIDIVMNEIKSILVQ